MTQIKLKTQKRKLKTILVELQMNDNAAERWQVCDLAKKNIHCVDSNEDGEGEHRGWRCIKIKIDAE